MKQLVRLLFISLLLISFGCSTFRTQTSYLNERSEKARVHFSRPKLAPPSLAVNFFDKDGDIVDSQEVSHLTKGFVRYDFQSFSGDTLVLKLQNRDLQQIGELRLAAGKEPVLLPKN